jgi:hypothetical protein
MIEVKQDPYNYYLHGLTKEYLEKLETANAILAKHFANP